jgi:hypothetical protein
MAVNESRSMNGEFHQGIVDRTYIQLDPERGGVISVTQTERLTWPTYRQAEQHIDHAFWEVIADRGTLPRERKTADSGDTRF